MLNLPEKYIQDGSVDFTLVKVHWTNQQNLFLNLNPFQM